MRPTHYPQKPQQGFSLVEILISLVIGLVVVGAVLVSYVGSGQTTKLQAAYADMNENAQIGLAMLSKDIQLAGYANATAADPVTGLFIRNAVPRSVFGCDNGFVATNASAAATCSLVAGSPAIEVIYEAVLRNTVPRAVSGVNTPTDCLGNALVIGGGGFYTAYNRYYIANSSSGRSELHCASWGQIGQPLIENVEAIKFWYGETTAVDRHIERYVTAGNLADVSFGNVVSVRICLLMRSPEPARSAEEGALTYLDCDSATQTNAAGDLAARRAYFTTVTLRNKMSL